jgi:hypothetical protein
LLLDTELDISTQRSTGGSLSTDCAPLRDVEVAVAEAEGEGDRDGLFVGSGEVERVAFGVVLADGLPLALLCGAGVVATLLGDLVGVALAFGVVFAADCFAAGCLSGVGCGFVVLIGVGVDDELGEGDAVADGEELGVEDAVGVEVGLGVEDAVGDGEELGVEDAVGFVDEV